MNERSSSAASPQTLVRPEILALSAYHVPPAAGMVKLDAMENPYRLPAEAARSVGRLAAETELNRYPDPSAAELKSVLRAAMGVPAGAELLLGNGSDEIIQIIAMALARPGATLLAPEPGFVMYRMIATFCGLRYVGVPLAEDFALDRAAVLAAMGAHRPAVVFLAWPNNPTGNLFDAGDVADIIRAAPGLVVVDEAYHAFAGASFMARLGEFPNLLVMRTLSKLGLAGLRLGLLAGAPAWLEEFDKLRLPYNINVLTQALAAQLLRDPRVLTDQAAAIIAERTVLLTALRGIPGVRAWDSAANFILLRVADAPGVFARLKAQGVLIKNLHGSHAQLANCLRVTVGTPEENARFIETLRQILSC
ncbi:MAG: histidinol-phosphate transaminase [Betaproteobacteria bacterium]|nr:histidinol-phosphate transaminase [Betaproteobacteria bacterium]